MEHPHAEAIAQLDMGGLARAAGDDQAVPQEVEVDLEVPAVEGHAARRETRRGDVQRDVPPVVARRGDGEPDLADDLGI